MTIITKTGRTFYSDYSPEELEMLMRAFSGGVNKPVTAYTESGLHRQIFVSDIDAGKTREINGLSETELIVPAQEVA